MAAYEILFQRPAQIHLQRIKSGWDAQLNVEKTVIHALEAERIDKLIVHANLRAGKTGHRINGHAFYSPALVDISCSNSSGYWASGSNVSASNAGDSGISMNW